MAAAKKTRVSDLRVVIAEQAVGLEEIAALNGVSWHTVQAWTAGKVPRGAPPFPAEVKVIGKVTRVYCADEVAAWIAEHSGRRTS